jgi:hypothetical protein
VRENFWVDVEYVANLIEDYNPTPHNAFYGLFTQFQVQFTRNFERYFIKESEYKLEKMNHMQEENNLKNYKQGNILLFH